MKVELIDHLGSDLNVVNAARVSFNKKHYELNSDDEKLIKYLARHNHWSPFAHVQAQFHFKAPIFVARQLVKHQVGMVWNEVSRRYVDGNVELYWPTEWRQRASDKKQGSSSELYDDPLLLKVALVNAHNTVEVYDRMVLGGCCPEQARMILPQNLYTEWYWTGSLVAWARVFKQRTDPHAQLETRVVVEQIAPYLKKLYPLSWTALMENS